MNLDSIERMYYIGIGGIGMSALAKYFNAKGVEVAGYDLTSSSITLAMEQDQISIVYIDDEDAIPSEFLDKENKDSNFVNKFGYDLKVNEGEVAHSINSLLHKVKGTNEEDMIEQLTIRTMAKAVYSTNNIGHYGLSFKHYSHFTSPIRRYPDVIVHRLLQHYLDGGSSVNQQEVEDQCKQSSKMEIAATEAERTSIKYKHVEFLEDKIGEEFEGVISGVSEWGLYVQIIDNMCEGMVRLSDIEGDYYTFDAPNYFAVGKNTGQEYRMGDQVKIKVRRADLVKKQLDFELV